MLLGEWGPDELISSGRGGRAPERGRSVAREALLTSAPMPHIDIPTLGNLLLCAILVASGYTMNVVKVIELVAGAALLAGQFVPLALTLLAPVVVNIALFHLVLVPNYGLVVFMLALEIFVAWSYRDAFRPMLDRQAKIAGA